MAIIFDLDVVMAKKKMKLKDLAELVDITEANLSKFKNGKAKAIRVATLDKLCTILECQPSEILRHE